MSTRVILTIQEEIECALCGRHLLRGERPDVFSVDGGERIVCELCGPRALSWGWERGGGEEPESGGDRVSTRRDRRRGLRGLLRRSGGAAEEPSALEAPQELEEPEYSFGNLFETDLEVPARSGEPAARRGLAPDLTDTAELAIQTASRRSEAPAWPAQAPSPEEADSAAPTAGLEPPERPAEPRASDLPQSSVARGEIEPGVPISEELFRAALEAFNAGEYRERVASIARLLGRPSVAVRPVPDREQAASITVAWEICWHRYEVDAGAGGPARRVAEGMELAELPALERESNAVLDERGELRPIAA